MEPFYAVKHKQHIAVKHIESWKGPLSQNTLRLLITDAHIYCPR